MGAAMLIGSLLLTGLFLRGEVEVQSAPVLVRVNGVEVSWSSCVSPLAPAELERALGGQWQRAAASGAAGDWWVFRHRSGTVLHTLQVRPHDGGSSGYCSALDAAAHPRKPARPMLALPGAVAIRSVIEQLDPGARSVQFVGSVPGEPGSWQRQLLRAAQARGWRALAGPDSAGPGPVGLEVPTSLVRAGQQVDVVVLRAGASWQFLLNEHPSGAGSR
jgi:hypothetical protein